MKRREEKVDKNKGEIRSRATCKFLLKYFSLHVYSL